MSAETLRKASALMRERAEAATPGPWVQGQEQDGEVLADGTGYVGDYGPNSEVFALDGAGEFCTMELLAGCRQDAEHIASWHPAVALAAADLLKVIEQDVGTSSLAYKAAEAFARAYLGDGGES